jgi:SAM-dependent methyltransferase
LEIGCGEGDLLYMIARAGAAVVGIDYSIAAIKTARERYHGLDVFPAKHNEFPAEPFDILVMQGVLEHLDNPFTELADMIERFKPKTVITSMPAFLNIRGIIWHTLDMLGAVMSKTDLHFIDLWEVEKFCLEHKYRLECKSIDIAWGNGEKMIEDLLHRIPLALKDGNIPFSAVSFTKFISWLENHAIHTVANWYTGGAVNIYRIDI